MEEYFGAPDLQQRVRDDVSQNPGRPELATPVENLQYQDLARRSMEALADPRSVGKQFKGIGDAFIQAVRSSKKGGLKLEETLGVASARFLKTLVDNAATQNHGYDPDVILGASELVPRLGYLMAKSAGAIQDGPPSVEEGGAPSSAPDLEMLAANDPLLQEQLEASNYMEEDEGDDFLDYEWSQEEEALIARTELVMAQHYGNEVLKNGELDQNAWKEHGAGLVMGERESGALEDMEMPIDPERAEQVLMNQGLSLTKGGGNGMG